MRAILVLLLSCLFIGLGTAQTPAELFAAEGLLLKNNTYRKGFDTQQTGIFYGRLLKEFDHPIALNLGESAKRNQQKAMIFALAGIGFATAGLLQVEDNLRAARILSSVGVGMAVVSIPLSFRADRQIREAVFEHNRSLLLRFD